MKKNNPHTPIMLREAMGTEPQVFTRYGMRCSFLLKQIHLVSFLAKIGRFVFNFVEEDKGADDIGMMRWETDYGKEKQESLSGKCESTPSFLPSQRHCD